MDALEALKATGARLTPQRIMILQVIREADCHLTADEIYNRVRKVYPYIDLATVYRTLQLFKRLTLVTEIDLKDGPSQFELAGSSRHHHLICYRCGATLDLPLAYLDDLRQSLHREYRFQADFDHLTIGGFCVGCAQPGRLA